MNLDVGARPRRVSLVNLVTNEERGVMFNPTELTEKISTTWADLQVVGLSHEIQHFINTSSCQYHFDLFYHALSGKSEDLPRIQYDRRFLKSMTHPQRSQSIVRGGPPRILFVWPNLLSLVCTLRDLEFKYTQFSSSGAPVAWNAKVQLREIRDAFVGMDDILSWGDDDASLVPAFEDLGDL
jgi:hypothetical protein